MDFIIQIGRNSHSPSIKLSATYAEESKRCEELKFGFGQTMWRKGLSLNEPQLFMVPLCIYHRQVVSDKYFSFKQSRVGE